MLTLLCKSAHSPPPQGSAHILKSLLQSQTDVGLDAGPLLPLPPEHLAEGRVRVGGAHGGVRWGGLCGAGEERRLREGKAAGAGSVSLDLRSHDPSPAGLQRPPPRPHRCRGAGTARESCFSSLLRAKVLHASHHGASSVCGHGSGTPRHQRHVWV